jgi:hypothetical protein
MRFPVGNKSEFVYSKFDQSTHILPAHLSNLLSSCQTFKTLEEHAQECYGKLKLRQPDPNALRLEFLAQHSSPRIAKVLNLVKGYASNHDSNAKYEQEQIESITGQLLSLVESGLLVSDGELLKLHETLTGKDSPCPISSIGVVTRSRIDSLRRCLTSFIENSKKYERTNDFVVMDDSESIAARGATQEMLLSLKRRYGVEIVYGGLEEKVRFAKALAAAGDVPPNVVEFALFDPEKFGYTTGANRNALLLHTSGNLLFSADDDTLCELVTPPLRQNGLGFNSRDAVADLWFFPDRESALESNNSIDEDVLSIHEQLLGKNINQCIAGLGETIDFDFEHCGTRLLSEIKFGRGAVLTTFTGLFGDSGLVAPFSYYLLEGESRERLTKSEQVYRSALTSREVMRVVSRPTISDNSWCMTTAVGFDNRALLPPFFPVQRNQDGVFGTTLRKCYEDGFSGHLPRAMLHNPPIRSYPALLHEGAPLGLSTFELIAACINSIEPGLGDSGERLRTLGRHFIQIGTMSAKDNEEFLRLQVLRSRSNLLMRLESLLQKYDESPAFWANDLKRHIRVQRAALLQKDYIVPPDLLRSRTRDEALQLNQRMIYRFGELLYWWPRLVETARTLRAQGQGLAQPV